VCGSIITHPLIGTGGYFKTILIFSSTKRGASLGRLLPCFLTLSLLENKLECFSEATLEASLICLTKAVRIHKRFVRSVIRSWYRIYKKSKICL